MSRTTIPRVEPRRDRLKRCSGPCGEWLPALDCFDRDRSRPDGLRSVCKACRREREEQLRRGAERRRPWGTRETARRLARESGR